MINVCSQCLRLNPLGNKQCNYCQADCQQINAGDLGQLMVTVRSKNRQKGGDGKIDSQEEELADYPDLRVYEDSRKITGQFEIVLARP